MAEKEYTVTCRVIALQRMTVRAHSAAEAIRIARVPYDRERIWSTDTWRAKEGKLAAHEGP